MGRRARVLEINARNTSGKSFPEGPRSSRGVKADIRVRQRWNKLRAARFAGCLTLPRPQERGLIGLAGRSGSGDFAGTPIKWHIPCWRSRTNRTNRTNATGSNRIKPNQTCCRWGLGTSPGRRAGVGRKNPPARRRRMRSGRPRSPVKPSQTRSNLRDQGLAGAQPSRRVKPSQTQSNQFDPVWGTNKTILREMIMYKPSRFGHLQSRNDGEAIHRPTGLSKPLPKGGRDLTCWPHTTNT
jgi:hypothetical protein